MEPQKIDDFFKEKFEQRSFEMKDKYWKDAERLIEEDRRRRRFGFFRLWTLMALLLIGVLGIWFFFSYDASDKTLSGNAVDQEIAIEQNPPSSTTQKEQKTERTDKKTLDHTTQQNKASQTTKQSNDFQGLKPQSEQETDFSKQENTKYSSSTATPHAPSREDAGEAVSPKNSDQRIEKDQSKLAQQLPNEGRTNSETTTTTTKQGNEETPPPIKNTPPLQATQDEAVVVMNDEEKTPKNQNNKAVDATTKEQEPITNTPDKKQLEGPIAKRLLQLINLPLVPALLETDDRLLTLEEDRQLEPLPEADLEKSSSLIKHWSLGLVTGMDLFPSTSNSQLELGYQLGLSLRYKLNAKWALQSALLFASRSGDFNNNLDSVVQVDYSFGRSERIFQFESNRIYTFELPLVVQFSHQRHIFEAGLQLHYLLGAKGNILEDRFLLPWEREELSTAYARSVLEPTELSGGQFKQFYTALQLAYHYQLTPRWQIGLQARWVPNGDNIEAGNNQFRLGMRYYFLKW